MTRYQTSVPIQLKTPDGTIILKPGDTFRPKSEEAIKGLLAEGKVRPVSEVMVQEYRSFLKWLKQQPNLRDELKERLPVLYQDIQVALEKVESAFAQEDLQAFRSAVKEAKELYMKALLICGGRVAIKVWSEVLQSCLWVVVDKEDIHSLRSQVSEVVYTTDEIEELGKLPKENLKEVLKKIHEVKETFREAMVKEINREGEGDTKDSHIK